MHTLQIDGHSHWLSSTPVQKALGGLINLTVEEGTPAEGSPCQPGPSGPSGTNTGGPESQFTYP